MSSNDPGVSYNWQQRTIPLLIDTATCAGFFFLTPWLGDQIFAQSSLNHFFLLPVFILFPAGAIAIRQLPGYSLNEKKDPSVLAACLVFFQIILYCLFYTYATNIGGDEKGNDNIAMILFFVYLLPALSGFFWPVTKARPDTRKALTAECTALFCVNYLTLLGAAVWDEFSSQPVPEDAVYATGISFLILYTILFLLFLTFFGLPRYYLLRATRDRIGLAFYLGGLAFFLWDKVPPLN